MIESRIEPDQHGMGQSQVTRNRLLMVCCSGNIPRGCQLHATQVLTPSCKFWQRSPMATMARYSLPPRTLESLVKTNLRQTSSGGHGSQRLPSLVNVYITIEH